MSHYNNSTGYFLLLLIFLAMPFHSQSQYSSNIFTNFTATYSPDGFVVLNSGDTLLGKIIVSWKYVENNPVEIQLLIPNQPKQVFKAGEIRGYTTYSTPIKEEEDIQLGSYICIPSFKKGVPVFMKLLLGGTITILENRSSMVTTTKKLEEITKLDGIYFGYSSDKGLHIGPSYVTSYRVIEGSKHFSSLYVSKNKAALMKLDKKNYESLFPSLFGDCPAIQQELEKNPDLSKFSHFMLLAEIYNRICIPSTGSH